MIRPLSLAALFIASPAMAQDYYEPDERIEEALSAQITEQGFDSIESAVQVLVPDLLGDALADLGNLDIAGQTVENLTIDLDVAQVGFTPQNATPATLEVQVTGFLDVSPPPGPPALIPDLDLLFTTCDVTLRATNVPISVDLEVELRVVTLRGGARQLLVELAVGDIIVDLDNNNLDATLCGGGDFLLGTLVGLIAPSLPQFLQGTIQGELDALEPELNDALSAASISDTFELLDAELEVSLEPKRVQSSSDGLELLYSAQFYADRADCITDEVDPGGGLRTDTLVPLIGDNPSATQIAAHASDDLLNQALYAVFRSGLLCQNIDEELLGDSLPISLDTGLLTLFGGDGFKDILGEETKPLLLKTFPSSVPRARFDGDAPITVEVEDLQLGFYGELDHRQARLAGLEIDVDAGADLLYDAGTGDLSLDLDLTDAFTIEHVDETVVPGSEQGFVDGVNGLVDTLLDSLLGDLLGEPLFTLPSFSGLYVSGLDLGTSGPELDWLTIDAGIAYDPALAAAGGCDGTGDTGDTGLGAGSGGCDAGGGCDSGCSSGGRLGGALLIVLPLWALRRRRR